MTETGRFGYTAFRPDTLHMTVHLDSVKHEQSPRFVLIQFLIILERHFASFLPTEKCPGDMARRLMPPLTHNDLPLLHFEQVRLSHRCNKNQENKGRRVRCCWTPNNKNWRERKNFHKEWSFKSGLQIVNECSFCCFMHHNMSICFKVLKVSESNTEQVPQNCTYLKYLTKCIWYNCITVWPHPGGQLTHSSAVLRPVLLLKVPWGQGRGEEEAKGQ